MDNSKVSMVAFAAFLCGAAVVLLVRPSITNTKSDTNLATSAAYKPDDLKKTLGIDVSHYQGDVDWSKVVNSNVKFAYGKATQGASYVDKKFAVNQKAAIAAGIPFGGYHFFSPDTDVTAQVDNFVKHANVHKGALPPVLDVESMSKKGSDTVVVKEVLAWIDAVETATNCQPVLYAGRAFYDSHLSALPKDIPFWLAEYSKTVTMPTGLTEWTFWQESQSAAIPGIKGNVDLDWFAGDQSDLGAITCK